jgi:hypothetical protein
MQTATQPKPVLATSPDPVRTLKRYSEVVRQRDDQPTIENPSELRLARVHALHAGPVKPPHRPARRAGRVRKPERLAPARALAQQTTAAHPTLKQPVAFRVESRAPARPGPALLGSFSRALAQHAAKPLAFGAGSVPGAGPYPAPTTPCNPPPRRAHSSLETNNTDEPASPENHA